MKQATKRSLAFDIALHLLVLLFLYTGLSKLLDYAGFKMVNATFPKTTI